MIGRAQTPVRTCIGCRQRASVSELLRVVAIASEADRDQTCFSLTPDRRRALSGRGAHVHPIEACLESALRRRAFGRALRVAGVFDASLVAEAIRGSTDPSGSTRRTSEERST